MSKRRFIVHIDKDKCTGCKECVNRCTRNVIEMLSFNEGKYASVINPERCSGCGKCIKVCSSKAITLTEQIDNNKTYKTMKTKGFGLIFMILLAIAGFSVITMLLWNELLPRIFGITSINFWQAAGLLVLTRVLFSGIGGHFTHMGRMMHGHKNPIREKWMKMTPEERKDFMFKKRHHWGMFPGMEEFDEKPRTQEHE